MPNIGSLVDLLGAFTGDPKDVALRARYLREGRLVPRSAKDVRAPQVEGVHAVSMLLGVLKAGPQVEARDQIKQMWRYTTTLAQTHHMTHDGTEQRNKAYPFENILTFGQMILSFIEQAANLDPEQHLGLSSVVKEVVVWRDRAFAAIKLPGWTQYYEGIRNTYRPPGLVISSRIQNFLLPPPVSTTIPNADRIETMTVMPVSVLAKLGEMVRDSRAEAARRGVTIPIDEALAEL